MTRQRTETDAQGRIIRQWDKHPDVPGARRLVYSTRSNSSLEYEQAFTDAPRRAKRRSTRIDPELREIDDPDVIARTLGTFRYGKGAA